MKQCTLMMIKPQKSSGSEDHEQLDIIPAQFKVMRHPRLKYAYPCYDRHIVTINQTIGKSFVSAGLLAFNATQKYCDALPLYQQSKMFKRIDIELDRANQANWMVKMSELTQPLINNLAKYLRKQSILHKGESTPEELNESSKTA